MDGESIGGLIRSCAVSDVASRRHIAYGLATGIAIIAKSICIKRGRAARDYRSIHLLGSTISRTTAPNF